MRRGKTWIAAALAAALSGLTTTAVVRAQLPADAGDEAAAGTRVVTVDDRLCLSAQDAVGALWTCVPAADAASDGVLLTSRSQDDLRLLAAYAALPDGAHDVTLSGPSGTREVSVVDHVVAGVAGDDATLSFTDAAGVVHTRALP